MNTRTKSTLGALILAVAGVLVAVYVPEGQREPVLAVITFGVGWLGLAKPGQK